MAILHSYVTNFQRVALLIDDLGSYQSLQMLALKQFVTCTRIKILGHHCGYPSNLTGIGIPILWLGYPLIVEIPILWIFQLNGRFGTSSVQNGDQSTVQVTEHRDARDARDARDGDSPRHLSDLDSAFLLGGHVGDQDWVLHIYIMNVSYMMYMWHMIDYISYIHELIYYVYIYIHIIFIYIYIYYVHIIQCYLYVYC